MDDEQRRWLNQYYSNIGGKEFFKLGCAVVVWVGIGMILSIIFSPKIFDAMFIAMFVLAYLCIKWQPTYLIFRKVIGNENLPTAPMPPRTKPTEHRKWWSYLPSIWWILIDILLLLAVLGWLSK